MKIRVEETGNQHINCDGNTKKEILYGKSNYVKYWPLGFLEIMSLRYKISTQQIFSFAYLVMGDSFWTSFCTKNSGWYLDIKNCFIHQYQ